MRYRCEILNQGIHGYEIWLHGCNQGRSGVKTKLNCANSIFTKNFRYLSWKYGLIRYDWSADLNHLLDQVTMSSTVTPSY